MTSVFYSMERLLFSLIVKALKLYKYEYYIIVKFYEKIFRKSSFGKKFQNAHNNKQVRFSPACV